MIVHIVCWKYKPETTEERRLEHVARLSALDGLVPGMESLDVGTDILGLDRSYDTGLVGVYADRAALDSYSEHPEHLKVAAMGRELATAVSVDFVK
ncbi:MAG TPA: Dabb family protein [Pyrinomonadaceae bacterium]|nr:Dabb family protein [Pyrinomonadaceae bacterium]